MTAANRGIMHSIHFSSKIVTTLPWGRGRVSLSKLGVEGVVATSAILAIFAFVPQTKNIAVMYLKLPVYVIIVTFFHN